jgi:N4-gp56 family major capsid protein
LATNFEFGTNDAETVKKWSELVVRDAEHKLIWAPMMYSTDAPKSIRHPDAGKGGKIIKVHTDFAGQDKKGDTLTIHNVARVTGRGVQGDGLLRDTGANLDTYTMTAKFENYAQQVRSKGELAEKRSVLDFRQQARTELSSWVRRKLEGAIVLSLWGITAPNNSGVLTRLNWNTTESEVFLNTIQAFDSDHIVYAGDATSNATIDSADVMTAQLLTKLETKAFEDLDIPLDPIDNNGEECLYLFLSGRGCEQLQYDPDWRDAQAVNARGESNPKIKGVIGKYGRIYVINYANCLNPAANVGQGVLVGSDALQMLKVEDPTWFEDFEDTRKRRKVISIGGMTGMAATYFQSARRNAIAVRHYVRS